MSTTRNIIANGLFAVNSCNFTLPLHAPCTQAGLSHSGSVAQLPPAHPQLSTSSSFLTAAHPGTCLPQPLRGGHLRAGGQPGPTCWTRPTDPHLHLLHRCATVTTSQSQRDSRGPAAAGSKPPNQNSLQETHLRHTWTPITAL